MVYMGEKQLQQWKKGPIFRAWQNRVGGDIDTFSGKAYVLVWLGVG